MKPRTEHLMNQERQSLAPWLPAILVAGILFYWSRTAFPAFFDPWETAQSFTLQRAIRAFLGELPGAPPFPNPNLALLSMILCFVVGPTLLFFAWRALRARRSSKILGALLFVAGGAITFAAVIPALSRGVSDFQLSKEVKQREAIETTKDQLMCGLDQIAVNAHAYRIVASDEGGGNNSYSGYTIPHQFRKAGKFWYEMPVVSPDRVIFRASSADLPGSWITLEVDTSLDHHRFTYQGAFRR